MKDNLLPEYRKRRPLYERLCDNVIEALQIFLNQSNVKYMAVTGRVKTFDSFQEKCLRKSYTDPFSDNEDFVGIRVILFYPSDIITALNIIDQEFDVKQSLDKSEYLAPSEFGYRSHHKVVTIKQNWCTSPNYRNLDGLKAEIQIRTILMHAWAEVEHQLQYKQKSDVPTELQRKLFRLSAKFEEADEQFEELKKGVEEYKDKIQEKILSDNHDAKNIEINFNTLNAYLNQRFPERSYDDEFTPSLSQLIEELSARGNSTINDVNELINNNFEKFLEHERNTPPFGIEGQEYNWIGVVRIILEITKET